MHKSFQHHTLHASAHFSSTIAQCPFPVPLLWCLTFIGFEDVPSNAVEKSSSES